MHQCVHCGEPWLLGRGPQPRDNCLACGKPLHTGKLRLQALWCPLTLPGDSKEPGPRMEHDRAAFHFLTDEKDRAAYIARLTRGLKAGGHAIIATFALDGPEKCSGLPVARYDAASLAQTLGPAFRLDHTQRHEHATPWGSHQVFQFSVFRREG